MKLLTYEGLAHVISEIKAKFVQKETGKGLSTNDYSNAEKSKLSGIENGAQVNEVSASDLSTHANTTSGVHGIPANAKYTDTTYTAATTSAAGLMSATDKTKLNGIATGAQVNEVSASDLSTHAGTTSGVHGIPADAKFTDTTYVAATTSVAGLMAAADKTKLNGVETGAQVNVLEGVSRNGVNLAITNKTVDVAVPTKVSDLTNDSGFQTLSQMQAYVANNTYFRYERVSQLDTPSAAVNGVIYLVSSPSGVGHEEWIIVRESELDPGVWEKLGDTSDINLDGYVQTTDLVAITTAEINAMFAA